MAQSQSVSAQPALSGRKALVGALILGAIAAGLIVAFLASRDTSDPAPLVAEPVSVVVATQDIPSGTTITADMLEEKLVPPQLLVSGALSDLPAVEGEVARYPVSRGEQITSARLQQAATSKTLSAQIPPGLRGFTVPVDVKNSPVALVAPGDFVDMIVSAELVRLGTSTGAGEVDSALAGSDKPKAALTLIQNIQVLSVQRNYVENGVVYDSATRGEAVDKKDDVNYVTLAVTPEQAQLIWLASQEGKITLSLRPFGDDSVTELPPVAEPIRIQTASNE